MFVKDHLLKIKDLAKSNAAIQSACTSSLDFLAKHLTGKESRRPYKEALNIQTDKKVFDQAKDLVEQEWDYVVDTLLDTFHVACTAANPRVIENALEALLTLVEKNMIAGSSRAGKISDLLAKSYEVKDDSVHMTILLAFGMLVAKPACELHDVNLMTAIRISYNIFLITANSSIQKMAKEKLTEIFRTLFQRLDASRADPLASASTQQPSTPAQKGSSDPINSRPGTPLRSGAAPQASITSPGAAPSPSPQAQTPVNHKDASTNGKTTPTSRSESANVESSDDELDNAGGDATSNSVVDGDATEAGNGEPSEVNKAAGDLPSFGVDDTPVPTSGTSTPAAALMTNRSSANEDIAFKDANQAFRGLCKLSVKPVSETQATNIHSFEIRSRILCLELLNSIFEEDTLATFRNNTKFVNLAMRKYLMDTIYCNIPSAISLVFRLTISLCVALVKEFRDSMKLEVESLLANVMLPILDSAMAPPQHRLAIIRSLYVICKSPQCLVDLFINYDCDTASRDIFETIAKAAAKAAQRKLPENISPEVVDQENLIRHLALKTCVCINIALVEWSKSLYEHPADAKARREAAIKQGLAVPPATLSFLPDEFQRRKEIKADMDQGKESFKLSFKKGIRFFWAQGFCEKNEKATALFLRQTPGLDKTSIGDFLGERDPVDGVASQTVLAEYIQLFNTRGMELDLSLRLFLGTFRLPGEGQKISRIMELFAGKYYKDNSDGSFGDADAVYYLCMAITMLTTSLHSQSVAQSDRLTLTSWKKLLLGQNKDRDYDDTMIDGIFARIAAEEFKVRGDEPPAPVASPSGTTVVLNDRQKLQAFLAEAKTMTDKAKEAIKEKLSQALQHQREMRSSSSTAFTDAPVSLSSSPALFDSPLLNLSASSAELPTILSLQQGSPLQFTRAVLPQLADHMVQATALTLLSTYSYAFDYSNDMKTVQMCLEGIRGGIRLSCLFNLKLERDAYVNALASLTLLEAFPAKEMKAKHLDAIGALMTVSEEEGNLGDNWKRVLSCISPLEKLLSMPPPSRTSNASQNDEMAQPSADELNVASVASKFRAISIDRIFTNSSRLSDEAISDFVSALCQVSKSELLAPALSNQTRIFSLQKLVEVADFNISRPKFVWMTMWNSVATHFTEAGLHPASHVALVAVDSLRQVSSKLLERHTTDSKTGGEFQVALLSPFEAMYANPNPDIRDYLICCLAKLMATHFKAVHSGWNAIFSVLCRASVDTPALVELGLHQLEAVKSNYFDSVVSSEHFIDYVQTLAKFASNPNISDKYASQAINLLKFAAQQLATGKLPLPSLLLALEEEAAPSEIETHAPASEGKAILFTSRTAHRGQWFPLLKGLTQTLENHDINTRPIALNALFETLNSSGVLFSRRFFKAVFLEVIFPVFDRVLRPAMTQLVIDDSEWLLTTCHKFLHGTVVLFGNFFDAIGADLLGDFLELLSKLTLQNNEKLSTFGITCLETLLTSTSTKYNAEMWNLVMTAVSTIMKQNMPPKLRVLAPNGVPASDALVAESMNAEFPVVQSTAPISTLSSATSVQTSQAATAASPKGAIPARMTARQPSSLNRSGSVRRSDPRKKILLGKAWIQNSALKMLREVLIDGAQPNEMINRLSAKHVTQVLDIYVNSFVYAYKVLRDPKLEDKMEQALYDLVLKQEIDSMWNYIEVLFSLYNEHILKPSVPQSVEMVKIVDGRILQTFVMLEQFHMSMAEKVGTLSDRRKRLHESNEALIIAHLSNVLAFADEPFLLFLPRIYASFIHLTLSDSIKVRETVRDVFARLGILKLGLSKEALATPLPAVDLADSAEDLVSPPTSPRVSPRKSRLVQPVEPNANNEVELATTQKASISTPVETSVPDNATPSPTPTVEVTESTPPPTTPTPTSAPEEAQPSPSEPVTEETQPEQEIEAPTEPQDESNSTSV